MIKNLNISTDPSPDGSNHNVKITWSHPPNPNGVVIIYEIEYAKIDDLYVAKDDATASPGGESEDTLENGVRFLINRSILVI